MFRGAMLPGLFIVEASSCHTPPNQLRGIPGSPSSDQPGALPAPAHRQAGAGAAHAARDQRAPWRHGSSLRVQELRHLNPAGLEALSPSLEAWTELQKKSRERERDEAGVPAAPCEGSLCQQALREPRFLPVRCLKVPFGGSV